MGPSRWRKRRRKGYLKQLINYMLGPKDVAGNDPFVFGHLAILHYTHPLVQLVAMNRGTCLFPLKLPE